jgi:hypothetical protein
VIDLVDLDPLFSDHDGGLNGPHDRRIGEDHCPCGHAYSAHTATVGGVPTDAIVCEDCPELGESCLNYGTQ